MTHLKKLYTFILAADTPLEVHQELANLLIPYMNWKSSNGPQPDYGIVIRTESFFPGYIIFDEQHSEIEKLSDFTMQWLNPNVKW